MSYSCTGTTTFTTLSTDYSNYDSDGEYFVTITAISDWDTNTKAKLTAVYEPLGLTIKKKDIVLCNSLKSGTCGQAGTFVLDFGATLQSQGVTEDMLSLVDDHAYIKVETKNGKIKEICTKNAPSSIQTASNPYVTGSSATSIVSTLVGAVALVALAGYAWKRRTSSENDADQRLYTGDIA